MSQKKLPLINSAHGSDTRNIINELIKLFNDMGYTYNEALNKAHNVLDEAEQINLKNIDTNERLDNIIADSGTSSTEVIDARGDETVLSARLDKMSRALGDIDILGPNSRSIPQTLIDHGVSVKDFGAMGDGVTDDSEAFINAADYTGRGVVIIPEGQFIVEGLPIYEGLYYVGTGVKSTILKSPDNPSKHMFSTSGAIGSVTGGSIEGLTLIGSSDGINPYNAIDFSSMSRLDRFTLRDLRIDRFDRGYYGTDNDRWAYIVNTQFHQNRIGIHCGEHPILVNVDCRYNDIALTGRINDLTALNCRFNYNRVGVEPGGDSPHGSYVANSVFQNCGFWKNTEKGAELYQNNIVVGGRPSGNADGDVCFVLTGSGNKITGNTFSQGASTGFGRGAIELVAGRHNVIENNTFNLAGGRGIVTVGDENIIYNVINNNIVLTSGPEMQPFIETLPTNIFYLNTIKDNYIYVQYVNEKPVISIPQSSGGGNFFVDNHFFVSGSTVMSDLLSLDMYDIRFKSNTLHVSSNATLENYLDMVNTGGNPIIDDNTGFDIPSTSKNAGEIRIEDGETSVIVEHGLTPHPSHYGLQITPKNRMDNGSFWVGNVTRTQFVINRSTSTGVSEFNWRVEL